jgi:hypothetical protein
MEVVRCRAPGCAGGRCNKHPRFTVRAKDKGRGAITGAFGFVPLLNRSFFTFFLLMKNLQRIVRDKPIQ